MSEQKQFETIRQQVRDWVTQNRAIFAERGGEMAERDGVDDGTAFYAVDCNCAAPAVRDFVGNKKGSLKTEIVFSGCLLRAV